MNIDLTNKQAVVCGATDGIGKAIAMELAANGATVILLARNESKLKRTLEELHANHHQHHKYYVADFERSEELQERVIELSANSTIHILINNTGGPPAGTAIDAEVNSFNKAFNMHLINNQILVQALVSGMKSAGYGRIINIISTSVKAPIKGLGVSNTVRGAVASWAKTLANELGPFGITVNNVLPGLTKTGRLESLISTRAKDQGISENEIKVQMLSTIPAGRFADVNEPADLVSFLASPAAAYINGTSIPVDGGMTPGF